VETPKVTAANKQVPQQINNDAKKELQKLKTKFILPTNINQQPIT
jgi:hypothetical protein